MRRAPSPLSTLRSRSSSKPVPTRRNARSSCSTRSSPPFVAHHVNAAVAAPRTERATVWATNPSGSLPMRAAHERGHHVAPRRVPDGRMGYEGRNRADQPDPDAELVELAGTEAVGGHDRAPEDVEYRLVVGCLRQPLAQPHQLGVELAPHHVRLRLVVPEEGAPAHPDRGRDLVDGRLVVALPSEQLEAARATSWRDVLGRRPRTSACAPDLHRSFHFDIECYKLEPVPAGPAGRPSEEPVTTTGQPAMPRPDRSPSGSHGGPYRRRPDSIRRGRPRRGRAVGRGRLHRRHVRCLLHRTSPMAEPRRRTRRASTSRTRPWTLDPQVSLRPEPFGALAYHFGTRRLSFLTSRRLLGVVESLATSPPRGMPAARQG